MQKYAVNQHLIETLLAYVKSGEIAIPEIQRPFVWDASQVRDLLDSLYQGYPVGYIIVWQNPDVKLKDGSTSAGKKVLIDGQQRITALTAAVVGQPVINKHYKQVNIRIAFLPLEERFEVRNPAIEKDKSWIADVSPIMSGQVSLLRLIREYQAANPQSDEDHLESVFTRLTGITKKQIGLIELAADLDIETVTEIFIRINREGVALSQADFAMSKIAANESFGGNNLRKAIDYFCHLAIAPEFFGHIANNDQDFAATDLFKGMRWLKDENDDLYDPGYADMLRVAFMSHFSRGRLADLVALLSGRNFEARTFEEEIAERSFATLKAGVVAFMSETHFKRFVMIIKSAGFVTSHLLKSRQGALNFAYALYLRLVAQGYEAHLIERYVRKWFVLGMLTGRYSGSAETQMDSDIKEVDGRDFGEFLASVEGTVLSDTFWSVVLVQELKTSSQRNAAFQTFIAAQVRSQARGFLSKEISVASMLLHRGDVHHIFPKAYLKKQLHLTQAQYNQVANFVYVQQETNIRIGDAPPSLYFSELREQCVSGQAKYGGIVNDQDMRRNLDENALPAGMLDESGIGYQEFLEQRRALMAEKLRAYYESL